MNRILKTIGIILLKCVTFTLCIGACAVLLLGFVRTTGAAGSNDQSGSASYTVMDRYDKYMTNTLSDALDGVLSIKKVYWLSDNDLIAPEPDPSCYGEAQNAAELQWLLDDAAELLEGQETLFNADTPVMEGTAVEYYYDPTILAITWEQVINNVVYNISEIKIADPSQFRRFLSDGEYASGSKYLTSEMAASVNAVVAANGDYYAMRQMGTIIYNSQVMRAEGYRMDTCYIDQNGDMLFVDCGEMTDPEEIQRYAEENGVRFSLAFGPILIEDGELCQVKNPYPVGEVDIPNARAAICQMDSLHYLVVIASVDPYYTQGVVLPEFARVLKDMGCDMAYNLDGGRSASLVMDGELKNYVYERLVSDIIYFATAIPNGE